MLTQSGIQIPILVYLLSGEEPERSKTIRNIDVYELAIVRYEVLSWQEISASHSESHLNKYTVRDSKDIALQVTLEVKDGSPRVQKQDSPAPMDIDKHGYVAVSWDYARR
jgi:hypothetical protein